MKKHDDTNIWTGGHIDVIYDDPIIRRELYVFDKSEYDWAIVGDKLVVIKKDE